MTTCRHGDRPDACALCAFAGDDTLAELIDTRAARDALAAEVTRLKAGLWERVEAALGAEHTAELERLRKFWETFHRRQ